MIREKVTDFIRVHGYTYKSFLISTFACPPAAVYIAYKKPDIGIAVRIALGIFGLVAAPLSTALVIYAVGRLVSSA